MHITCPHCNFSRSMDPSRVPDRPVKVSCPQCNQAFDFDKNALAAEAPPPAGPAPDAARPILAQTRCPACGLSQAAGDSCTGCGVVYTLWHQRMATSPQSPQPTAVSNPPLPATQEYAGFWIRVVAYILDSLILGAVQLTLTLALTFSLGVLGMDNQGQAATGTVIWLFGAVLSLAYAVFFTGYCGQTPGKMALRIKVIHVDGSQISYGRAALREIPAKFISGILLGAGYIMVAFDSKKQGLHDRIANTYVIKL